MIVNPFFFGNSKQRLFGVYHPAQGRSTRGVVLCYPWAREYLLSHGAIRLLAQRLAESGWHTMRFDYLGTGDSAGDATVGSQDQWLADIAAAVEELQDIAQVKEVVLVGMRYGATLAALAAEGRSDISRLVLWDPVTDGSQYLADLGAAGTTNLPIDVEGAVLTQRLRDQMRAVTRATFGRRLPRTLVVSTSPATDGLQPFVSHLRANGVDCSLEHVPDVQVWREEWGRGGKGLSANTVGRIVSWLQ